jgi:beta-phosphoglucomutase family hydrolase
MRNRSGESALVENNELHVELPFKGVIFDMDGTLLQTTEADYQAWKLVFEDEGRTLTHQDYFPLLGIRSNEVIKNQLGMEGDAITQTLQKKMRYFEDYIAINPIEPLPFAEAFLQQLQKYPLKMALATSSRKAKMELVMTQVDFLQYFDELVTGEEVDNGKPAPDIFIKAAKKLGLQPEECFVVEDAFNGVKSAKAANMKCVAITGTHEASSLTHADKVINTYENLDVVELCASLV